MNRLKVFSLLLIVLLALGAVGGAAAQEEDTLNLLYWQAPSTMNQYLASGTKEQHAMSLVNEPLARYNPDGVIVPYLAAEIPTLDNGGVSEDLTSITWTLRDDILWSDGTPFTAADVVFTAEYCMDDATGCSTSNFFDNVASVEAVDDFTVLVTFDVPKPNPYGPFVGVGVPILQAAQFADCVGANAQNCTDQNFYPIGTGPYIVEDFRANDVITYVANPNYRDAAEGKPYFKRVVLKGGGDAESAARAVLETGEADYAWNLQISPAVLNSMEAAGLGTVVVAFATNIERIVVNFTNPDSNLGDMRSVRAEDGSNDHPFLSVKEIRQALSMAIDRNIIAEQLYGAGGRAACNIINGPTANISPNNDGCLTQDIAGANALLDEVGAVDSDGDGIREYNGVPLFILFQTSTNAVRQSTQALVKQWWTEIGVETELRNIDAAVYFGGDVASPDTLGKFYADIQMYTSGTDGTDAETFLSRWTCDEVTGPENNFLGGNTPRWCNPDYDALLQELAQEGDLATRSELTIALNDMFVQAFVEIPLVHRGSVSAHANSVTGIAINGWDSELWNIADWGRAQ